MYANLIAAAALLAAPLVSATDSAIVQNQCTFPVYIWSVAASSNSMVTVPAGKSYSETFRVNTNGGGISIKIASEPDLNAGITQFEYTLTDTIWYDISNINGYPFMQWGVSLVPTSLSCPVKSCKAGVEKCTDAYNVYNDDTATANCAASSDLVLELCNNGGAALPSVTSSSAAAVVSSSTKASTSTSTAVKTSTTVKTVGTTFITKASSASSTTSAKAVTVTAAPASSTESSNPNEVVITTYVTSWTTVDGSEPTSTQAPEASSTSANWRGRHSHNARAEEHRHNHVHAREIVA